MSARRLWIDTAIGERRGVVTLDGRPERLIIERDGAAAVQAAGAHSNGRVRRIEKAAAIAFVELAEGPDGVLNLATDSPRLTLGQLVAVEIRIEARGDKGPVCRLVGEAQGGIGLTEAAPSLAERLERFAPGVAIETSETARAIADGAQQEALAIRFALAGGGSITVEPTRALTAVDVDLGDRSGSGAGAKTAARAANFAALSAAARVLRLKGLGGLVAIDLVGRGHDGPALLNAARTAFAPDNPGVAFAPISRFGVLELTVPRRLVPSLEILVDEGGAPRPLTIALDLVRRVEREARLDGGARLRALAAPEVVAAAGPALALLGERIGGRASIEVDPTRARHSFEVVHG